MVWTEYTWEDKNSHPPTAGRYLIYRSRCDKMHFEQWNGSGWASTRNEPIKWSNPRLTLC